MSVTILLVEDHHVLRRTLRGWLEVQLPGCQILEATTGEEALLMAQDTPPKVVIMDIGLPGISGLETTKHIKATIPTAKVVILTKYEGEAYRLHAIVNGASAYVWKDAMLTELLPTLSALL
ncbi:MAG: response regulator transcription factor [Anaerolineae bacterium]